MVCQGGAGPYHRLRRARDPHERTHLAVLARCHPRCIDRHAGLREGIGAGRQVGATRRPRTILRRTEDQRGKGARQVDGGQPCAGRNAERAKHQDLEQLRTPKATQVCD